MSGNVWEWISSLWGKDILNPDFKYPYDPDDGREDLSADDDVLRVLRGGSFIYLIRVVRCAFRNWNFPDDGNSYDGFRVVSSSPSTSES